MDACAARDGEAVTGVAERARPKIDQAESWIVAEQAASGVVGFVLATVPGSGLPADPPGAPVIGLLAVTPASQRSGLGSRLVDIVAVSLARHGHKEAVLHVLAENQPAVELYMKKGWRPRGTPFEHALLKRATQTYALKLP